MAAAAVNTESSNRAKDVKEFDESKTGVKGLVDSGITTIPRLFVHPPETLTDLIRPSSTTLLIPTIDLSAVDSDLRSTVVENIACASRELGFFQIINHEIKVEVMDCVIGAINRQRSKRCYIVEGRTLAYLMVQTLTCFALKLLAGGTPSR